MGARQIITLLAIFYGATITHALAQTIELFDKKGHPTGEISQSRIHAGDILKFSDGTQFKILAPLGHGNVNVVFKAQMIPPQQGVPKELALRLPMIIEGRKMKIPPQEYINSYIDGYDVLEKNAIPIPKKYKSGYGQYVASELIENDFNGHDFFANPDKISNQYSPEVLQEAEEALVQFARFTMRFKSIGDFSPGQLVYNIKTKSWTLLDWFNQHELLGKNKMKREKIHTFKEAFEGDLTVVEGADGVPATNRELYPREKRIIERLGTAVLAERNNFSYIRCFINNVFKR